MATDKRKVQLETEVVANTSGLDAVREAFEDIAQVGQEGGQQAARGLDAIGQAAEPAAQKLEAAERRMEQAIQRRMAAMRAGAAGTADYFAAISQARGLDTSKFDAAIAELRALEQAEKALQKASQEAARADAFIGSLQSQAQAAGRTRSEILALQAAELGLADKAAPYIARLREVEQGQNNVGMSAKATAAALRGVPAQFTDIVTSLASGQRPMQVIIQQGGQLKDMFGGIGPAARALGGYVVGLVNPFTVAAGAVAVFGVELAHAESQLRQLNSVQVLLAGTGRSSLFSTSEIKEFIAELSKAPGVTREVATQIVTELAKAHEIGGALFRDLAKLSADYARATGTDVPTAARALAKAFSDPQKGAKDLEEALGLLTSAQVLTIERLSRLGDVAGAQRVLLDAVTTAVKGLANEGLTPLQRSFNEVGNAWERLGERMDKSPGLRAANAVLAKMIDSVAWLIDHADKVPTWALLAIPGAGLPMALARGGEPTFRGSGASGSFEAPAPAGGGAPAAAASDDDIKRALEAAQAYRSQAGQIAELVQKRTAFNRALQESIALYGKESKEGKEVQARLRDAIAGINEQIAKSQGQGESNVAAQRAARRIAEEENRRLQASINSMDFSAPTKLTEAEKKVIQVEEELRGSLLGRARAMKEAELQAARNAVQEERRHAALEKQAEAEKKAVDTMHRQEEAIGQQADATRQQADAQEAANASFGKSKTAIEEMTLAHLKLRAAEDGHTDKFYANLQQQIDAQERLVKALKEGEFLQKQRQLTEEGRAAQEDAQTLQLEISLLGRTREEREVILAQRRAEVELAKELAEIEKLPGTTDEDRRRRDELREQARANAARKGETAAGRASLQEWERINDRIGQSLTDAIIEGGSHASDSLKRMFKDLVLRPVVQAIMSPVSGAITGIAQQIGGSIIGGGGSMLGNLGNFASLGNLFGAGATTSTGLGLLGADAAGAGFLGSAGSFLGGMAANVGASLGIGAGATTSTGLGLLGADAAGASLAGIGSAFATAMPYIGVALLAAQALGAFKQGGGPKFEGKAGPGLDWFNAPNRSGDAAAEQLRKGLQDQFDGIARALGSTQANIQFGVGLVRDPKGTAAGTIGVTANRGGSLLLDEFSQDVGRSDEEFQAAFTAFASRSMLRALQAAHIDGVVGQYLKSLGDITDAAADKVQEALTRLQKIATERSALDDQLFALTHTQEEVLIRQRERERNALDELNRSLYDHVAALADLRSAEASARDALLTAYNAEATALRGVIDRQTGFAQSLRELRDSLPLGADSPLTRSQRAALAGSRFTATLAGAISNDERAQQALGGTATDLLQAVRNSARSPVELATAFARVQAGLVTATASADARASVAQKQLDAMTQQLTALGILNNTVKDVGSLLGTLLDVQNKISQEQLKYQAAQAAQDVPTTPTTAATTAQAAAQETEAQIRARLTPAYTTTTPDWYSYTGESDTPTLHPGSQTVDTVALEAAVQAELARRGIATFAAGGLASGGLALVGERGPELVDFREPGRVYTAEQTRGMFGSNAALERLLERVLAELQSARQDGRIVSATTAGALQKISATLKKFDTIGMPPERPTVVVP